MSDVPEIFSVTADSFRLFMKLLEDDKPKPILEDTNVPSHWKWFSPREAEIIEYLTRIWSEEPESWATARQIGLALGVIVGEKDSIPGTFSWLLGHMVERGILESSTRYGYRLNKPTEDNPPS